MTTNAQNGIGDFLRVVIEHKPEKEADGFLVPKEAMPHARMLMGLCPMCGHEWTDGDSCSICGHGIDDTINIEDVEDYDGNRRSN